MTRFRAALPLLLCLAATPGGAEEAGQVWLRRHMAVSEGTSWGDVEQQMRVFFFATDINGGGITHADYDLARRVALANLRAGRIANWARYDLDGDGTVTRTELTVAIRNEARLAVSRATGQAPTREQVAEVLEELVTGHMEPDTDGDGAVTFGEILAEANRVAEQMSVREGSDELVPMALDLDGDGTITLNEYMSAVRSTFDGIDRDGDGQVSALELNLFHRAHHP